MVVLAAALAPAALAQSAPVQPASGVRAPVQDDGRLPATRAGVLIGQWLTLCKAPPDLEQLTAWFRKNLSAEGARRVSPEQRARDAADLCALHGGFRVGEITKSDLSEIVVLLQGSRSGLWIARVLVVDDAGRIARTGGWPAGPPESALPKDLSDAAIASDVTSKVASLSQLDLFSGIAVVARGAHPIATATAGFADRARHTPITAATQFTLASMGKMFTAVAVGQLIDQGTLSLDDKVGKFFPDYPNKTIREQATVGMLLSHMSGLGDFLDRRTPEMMKHGVTRAAAFMPLYDADAPRFPPGTAASYSNAGLALTGAIVEKVSGEDYPDYLRRHIFAVAGMTGSDPNNIPHITAALVTPYTRGDPPSQEWHEAERDIGSPAGGAISTADDLVRFADGLRSGKLLSPATFTLLASPHPGSPDYGYGFVIEQVYGRTVVAHGGGFPGVSTELALVLSSPYTIVVLSNQDPESAQYAASWIEALIVAKAKAGQ